MWSIWPSNHRLGCRLGHGTSGFTLGFGDTRNMGTCPALSMGCSRSRSQDLTACVLLFPSQTHRFPFWRNMATVSLSLPALISPFLWYLQLKTQQSRLWSGQASVTPVILLHPLQLLFILLQPLLLILLILWLVTLYSVPSTKLTTFICIFSCKSYEVRPMLLPLPR